MNAKRYLQILSLLVVTIASSIALCSCVSIKSYRETKAQMLWGELQITKQQQIIDSLATVNGTLVESNQELQSQSDRQGAQIRDLKSTKSKLEIENTLLRSELGLSE